MHRQWKASRILELLGRPEDSRVRGMTNLAMLSDAELDALLNDVEQNTRGIVEALRGWLERR